MDGTNGLSASDIALLGNDGMGGMNGFFWVFALLILAGGGLGGFGTNNSFGQFATSASQNEILLGQKFDALSRQINQVGDGLASSTFSLNNQISNEGRSLQAQLCSINSNIDNKFAMLEKTQLQAQIAEQAQQINQLNLQAMMAGVVRYPMASTYAMNNNPFCNCNCM